MEEPARISFTFNKVIKKAPTEPEEKKQFIDCIDSKSILIKGGESKSKEAPLVIPLKQDIRKSVINSRLEKIAQEVESGIKDSDKQNDDIPQPDVDMKPPENESLEALAAREIMEDIKKKQKSLTAQPSSLIIPTAGKLLNIEGEKESKLEDYESIPIHDFGMAMLRGMGWTPGKGMGKHKAANFTLPTLRPKGMGLGADVHIVMSKNKPVTSDKDSRKKEKPSITKDGYVKVIAGSRQGTYGQVLSFDEYSNRITLKTAIKGENIEFSEHLLEAVSKDEYVKCSKVINSAKYEEYKMKENGHGNSSRFPEESNRKYNDGYHKKESDSLRHSHRDNKNKDRNSKRYSISSEKYSSRGRKEEKKEQGDEESKYGRKRDERHKKYQY